MVTSSSLSGLRRAVASFIARAAAANVRIGAAPDLTLPGSGTSFVHGGIRFDSSTPSRVRWSLKEQWSLRFASAIDNLILASRPQPLSRWEKVVGMAVWFIRVLDAPLVVLRPLIEWMAAIMRRIPTLHSHHDPLVSPWRPARKCLASLALVAHRDPWVQRRAIPRRCVVVWTDASDWGWGAVISRYPSHGGPPFPSSSIRVYRGRWHAKPKSMPLAEALATWFALRRWSLSSSGSSPTYPSAFIVVTDCEPWFHAVRRMYSHSPTLSLVLRDIFRLLQATGSTLVIRWVKSADQIADAPSRGLPYCPSPNDIFAFPPPSRDEIPLPTSTWCDSSVDSDDFLLLSSSSSLQYSLSSVPHDA
jgi:hypothetical protein